MHCFRPRAFPQAAPRIDRRVASGDRSRITQRIPGDVVPGDRPPLVTKDLVESMIDEELVKIQELTGVALADSFAEFLTLPGCDRMP